MIVFDFMAGVGASPLRLDLVNADGSVHDLSGRTVRIKARRLGAAAPLLDQAGTVASPATAGGAVFDGLGPLLTDPGEYRATVHSVIASGGGGEVVFGLREGQEIVLRVKPATFTFGQVERFRAPLRFLLGDRDPVVREYEDEALDDGVRAVFSMGLAPEGYAISPDFTSILPAIMDPTAFGIVALQTALFFKAGVPARHSVATRGWRETKVDDRTLVREMERKLHVLKNGEELSLSWQSFDSWARAIHGLNLAAIYSEVRVTGSTNTISLSA